MIMINGTRNPFEEFVHAARRPHSEPGKIAKIHSRCLLALVDSDLPDRLMASIEDQLKWVLQLARRHGHLWSNYSALTDWRDGRSKVKEASIELDSALQDLQGYLALVPVAKTCIQSGEKQIKPFKPDGYSASDLQHEGEIGQSLWQKILRLSTVRQTTSGDHGRRFSNHEILIFADTADAVGTPKTHYAAQAWRTLIATPAKMAGCGT